MAAGAVALPALLLAGWALLVHPEPASLLVPFFGPWAGVLYGHWECTLAAGHPWGLAAVALALVGAAALAWRRGGILRGLAGGLLGALLLAWFAAALLSGANTLV
jgi:hypothetical protein